MSRREFECTSGAPLCHVKVLAEADMNNGLVYACQRLLQPHSLGEVPEFKEIRVFSDAIYVRVEFNPGEAVTIQVDNRDRFLCDICQIPNKPLACEVSCCERNAHG